MVFHYSTSNFYLEKWFLTLTTVPIQSHPPQQCLSVPFRAWYTTGNRFRIQFLERTKSIILSRFNLCRIFSETWIRLHWIFLLSEFYAAMDKRLILLHGCSRLQFVTHQSTRWMDVFKCDCVPLKIGCRHWRIANMQIEH